MFLTREYDIKNDFYDTENECDITECEDNRWRDTIRMQSNRVD